VGRGAKLAGATLDKSIGRYAKFNEADFSRSRMVGVDYSMAELQADFSDAELMKSDFRGADFSNANLTNANLTQANLLDAKLRDVNLSQACLENAIGPTGQKLSFKPQGERTARNLAGQVSGGAARRLPTAKSSKPWWQFWG
jgi:uncharacterized protein YjbI with pentapeptide repeats